METPGHAGLAHERRLTSLPENKRALLEVLRAQRARNGAGRHEVETLREGRGDALVLIHPVGGEVLCYGELVRLLPGTYPVSGIAGDELLRQEVPPRLDRLVRHYLTRIERAGVSVGMLAGWSFGGIVAYEMTREFAARGRPCPVVVIDAIPADTRQPVRVPSEAQLREAFAFDLVRSSGSRPEELAFDHPLWDLPRRECMTALKEALERYGLDLTLTVDDLDDRALMHANAFVALEKHRPRPSGPPVNLLWATRSVTDPTPWWHAVAGEPVRRRAVVADHHSLLRPPAVGDVAAFVHTVFTEEIVDAR